MCGRSPAARQRRWPLDLSVVYQAPFNAAVESAMNRWKQAEASAPRSPDSAAGAFTPASYMEI